jgi:hypothetical protein
MDGTGRVVEVPSEGTRSEQFAARVPVNRYRVAEAGGLIWAFFGRKEPPGLPPLPFLTVPEDSRWFCRMKVNCNWLHQGWAKNERQRAFGPPPVYEIERTAYGLRTAAMRESDDEVHLRVAEFVAPFFAFSASRQPSIPSDCSVFISVPVDDETHLLFFGFWDASGGKLHDISKHFSAELDLNDLMKLANLHLPHSVGSRRIESVRLHNGRHQLPVAELSARTEAAPLHYLLRHWFGGDLAQPCCSGTQ